MRLIFHACLIDEYLQISMYYERCVWCHESSHKCYYKQSNGDLEHGCRQILPIQSEEILFFRLLRSRKSHNFSNDGHQCFISLKFFKHLK